MKTFYALLIAALFTTACAKKKDEAAKTDPATKPTEAAKVDPATATPATPDPAKAEPAAAGGMTVDEAGTKVIAMMDKVASAVTGAGGDCAKMGTNLKALTAEVKAMVESGKDIDKDPAKKKEFDEKYGPKLMKQMGEWTPAVEKCKDNADVKAFFESMG
jgi:hypothetical protein